MRFIEPLGIIINRVTMIDTFPIWACYNNCARTKIHSIVHWSKMPV